MTTAAENVFEQVIQNMRQATESSLKMQQDVLKQWTSLWPAFNGFPTTQSVWTDKILEFRREWTSAISDLAHKHKHTLDRQYEAALESLDEALRVGQSSTPEDFRKRTEQFCRKALECMRDASEAQMKEYQQTLDKLGEMVGKIGS
jgi:hypothetical protein